MASLSDQPTEPRPALRGSGAKTDSDLARPPSREHLAGQPQARQSKLLEVQHAVAQGCGFQDDKGIEEGQGRRKTGP